MRGVFLAVITSLCKITPQTVDSISSKQISIFLLNPFSYGRPFTKHFAHYATIITDEK